MKVQGSYSSIVRGVSQQQPQDRLEGQHGEVINMISDPVRGLVRRNGFVLKDAQYSPVVGAIADAQADSYSFRAYGFTVGSIEYDLIYRSRPVVGGSIGANHLAGLHCFRKSPGVEGFIPVVTDPLDTAMDTFTEGGYSAVTAVGRFLALAGNEVQPTYVALDRWGATANQRLGAFWVRGGGYSRTYTVKARRGSTGVVYTASHTTDSAAYPGDLDITDIPAITPNLSFIEGAFGITSDHTFTAPATGITLTADSTSETAYEQIAEVPGGVFTIYQTVSGNDVLGNFIRVRVTAQVGTSITVDVLEVNNGPWDTIGGTNDARWYPHGDNPSYQTNVNEVTAAYNRAVNAWAVTAADSILPANIAQGLVDALTTAGFPGWTRDGSHAFNSDCDYIEVTDSAEGDFIVALGNQTPAADEVTPIHQIGKIVKVAPRGNEVGSYYLEAFARNPGNADTYQDVVWREAAGTTQTPSVVFAIGTVENGTLYVASTPALLNALILAEEAVNLGLPPFAASAAGDLESSLPPAFYQRPITALFVFQNRLCIASGPAITMSKTADYLNFYRSTVLTIPDDDPIEGFALGSEGDSIRKTILYDRNLLLFGDKAIYNISGRSVQTPQTFNIAVQLNVDNTSFAQPVGAGPNVSFLKEDTQLAATRMLQVRAGLFQDSPVVDDASKQLRDYINGTPAEMVSLVSPDVVFIRTEFFLRTANGFPRARPWGLYVFHYLDQPNGERQFDAWSAWEWSSALGVPVGITSTVGGDGIWMYTLAWGTDQDGIGTRGLLALTCSARPDPTGLPYLDGLQQGAAGEVAGLWTPAAPSAVTDNVYTSFGAAYSYGPTPTATDADRTAGLIHPHYTVGDGPPETYDPLRWEGLQGWYSDAQAEFGTEKQDNMWTGLAFPAYVDITQPFVRTREGKANTLGRLTLTKLRLTTTRTAGFKATFIDTEGQRTTTDYGGSYYRYKYDTNVWVGRNVHDVQVRLEAKLWYPLTISGIEWQGQWFTNARRVS